MKGLRPIAPPRAHEEVAEQLRRQIALRLVGPAGVLPPERDLARLFRVGRATVQRAIEVLQAEGLVERRRGRRGGTFVVGPVADAETDGLIGAVRREQREIEEALSFRLAIEPAAAALAALVAPPADVDAVASASAAAAAAGSDAEFMEHDTAFHLAIGRASGNRFFAEAIERLRVVLNDALEALPDSAAWHGWSNDEHARVVAALLARDAETARDAMAAHVLRTDDAIRALLAAV